MADQTFKNVVNGELVESVSGETYDVIDPTTGEVYAQAPKSGDEDVDRAYAAADAAFEGWGYATPQDRSNALLKIADAIEDAGRGDQRRRVQGHRQAARADHGRGDAATPRTTSSSSPAPRGCSRASRPASTWPTTPRGYAASRSASSAR